MDPSHFRGLQPPASHVIPGAPGAAGHPPHIGFIEPPFIIPAAFLSEIITTIRNEFVSQNRLITNQFSGMRQEYGGVEREMKETFELCVRQTDRILAEQYARFELRLEGIQNSMRHFHESQTAAITDLEGKLKALDGLTETSREALASKIATIVETMGHGFGGLVAMIKSNEYVARDQFSLESGIPAYSASLQAFPGFPKLPDGPPITGNTGYESRFDHVHGAKGALIPAAWSQTDSEVDINTARSVTDHPLLESGGLQDEQVAELPPVTVLSDAESPSTSSGDNPETEDQDQLYDADTPAVSTPATEETLVPPTMDTNDDTTIPASPPTIPPEDTLTTPPENIPTTSPEDIPTTPPEDIPATPPEEIPATPPEEIPATPPEEIPATPPEDIPTTPHADGDPLQNPPIQDPLFDTASPLTSVSSPRSQYQEAPTISFETTTPTPLSKTTSKKRKRESHGRGALKSSRKNRKSRPQGRQEEDSCWVGVSEGNHADLSIWPPPIEDDSIDQKYVGCDRCAKWFHFVCVGLQGDHEDDSPWECPLCVRDPTRDAYAPREGFEMCARPGCTVSKGGEYFMSQLLGRCYAPDQGVVKYLVAYEGYGLDQCTWEPPESFSDDSSKIEEFLEWWATENPGVNVESLDRHETIFLHEAYVLARAGITWPGA